MRDHKAIAMLLVFLGGLLGGCTRGDSGEAIKYGYSLGMNLDYVSSWTTQIVYVDVFKQSHRWDGYQLGTTTWTTSIDSIPLPLDSKGYPAVAIPYDHDGNSSTGGFVVHTHVFFGIGSNYPAGSYTLRFTGQGKVSVGWDAGYSPEKGYGATPRSFASAGGTVSNTVPVEPNIGISIRIDESHAANPIRDIQLLLPGYESSETSNKYHPFYPPFVTGLQGFKVIRLMQAFFTNEVLCDDPAHVATNRSAYKGCVISWSNRVPADYYTHTITGRGMPWEYAIDLVNAVDGANIWINLPHAATTDYARQAARLLRSRLKSDRKVYIELSNEVWNTGPGFPQYMWFQDNGADAFPGYDLAAAGARFYVSRLVSLFSVFEQEFAGEESRLVRVLASQGGYTQRTIDLLSYLENTSYDSTKGGKIDAVAIGAYFGFSLLEKTSGTYVAPSVDTLLASASADIARVATSASEAKKAIEDYRKKTGSTSEISLLAYEGGSHITPVTTDWAFIGLGTNSENFDWSNYAAANRDSRLYDSFISLGNAWFQNGGSLFNAFSYVSKYPGKYTDRSGNILNIGTGTFGHLETLDQSLDSAPKYRALKDMMR